MKAYDHVELKLQNEWVSFTVMKLMVRRLTRLIDEKLHIVLKLKRFLKIYYREFLIALLYK